MPSSLVTHGSEVKERIQGVGEALALRDGDRLVNDNADGRICVREHKKIINTLEVP